MWNEPSTKKTSAAWSHSCVKYEMSVSQNLRVACWVPEAEARSSLNKVDLWLLYTLIGIRMIDIILLIFLD